MLPLVLWLAGCSGPVDCSDPDKVLAEADGRRLVCSDAAAVADWIELLGGRPLLQRGERGLVVGAVAERFAADPGGTTVWLEGVQRQGAELAPAKGLQGAELRARAVWHADHGDGLIRPTDGELWNFQKRAVSVWTKDDEEQLAMTESDLEGWIRYASLCREAQGGGVVRISVADRVTVYQMLIDRFTTGSREEQVALASLGPTWPQVVDAWASASYEDQQAWIARAPLPPPMTASSLAYVEAVFQGDVVRHAAALQDVLGPFAIDAKGRFAGDGASP